MLVATHLPSNTTTATASHIAKHVRGSLGCPTPTVQRAIEMMITLLEGEKTDLSDIECDFDRCDRFARQVYEIARTIPAGETSTYGDIAGQLGDKQLARRVGRVLGQNPLPIIVPCHRVIGANQKLVGFSAPGGLDMKLKMLMIEGAKLGDEPGLFDGVPMKITTRTKTRSERN